MTHHFDVYQPDNDIWLKQEAVFDIASKFGIDMVPFVLTGTIGEAVHYVKRKPLSHINEAHPMEGLVGRPEVELRDRLGRRVIVKVKARDFE